jgi:O-succinylbenzoic acid--CoA ligase
MNREFLAHLKANINRTWLHIEDSDRWYELTTNKIEELLVLKKQLDQQPIVWLAESKPIEFITGFLAAITVDVNLFLCNPHWQQSEWQQVLQLTRSDLIWAEATVKSQINSLQNTGISIQQLASSLIMIPTGGTSGNIRFAMHTLSSLMAAVRGFKTYFQSTNINSYCVLPLFHVSGLMQLLRSWFTQGELVILPYSDLKQGKKTVVNYPEYFISLVPTQLQFLLQTEASWLSQFKTVLLGGAPVSQLLLDRARELNIALAPTYGMTETASQVATLKPEDFLGGKNNSGRVLPHAQLYIQQEQPTATFGTISLKADSLCLGYYPQCFESEQLFITDDLGYFDAQGYLHLVGRNSQKIITGGENVFPAEVEAAILATQLVKDVCVIGLPDSQWGQIVTAIYIPIVESCTEDSIASQLKLSKYKHPKRWIRVSHLPRNDRGKIDFDRIMAIVNGL